MMANKIIAKMILKILNSIIALPICRKKSYSGEIDSENYITLLATASKILSYKLLIFGKFIYIIL